LYVEGGSIAIQEAGRAGVRPDARSPNALGAACSEVGCDPKTLLRTIGAEVDMPGAISGRAERSKGKRTSPMTGTPEEMAETIRAYAALGISHLQLLFNPNTVESLEAFAPVLELIDCG
jgi:hypothetical protein